MTLRPETPIAEDPRRRHPDGEEREPSPHVTLLRMRVHVERRGQGENLFRTQAKKESDERRRQEKDGQKNSAPGIVGDAGDFRALWRGNIERVCTRQGKRRHACDRASLARRVLRRR